MPDMKTVIEALELCTTPVAPSDCSASCLRCHYNTVENASKLNCIPRLLKDSLDVLKQQENESSIFTSNFRQVMKDYKQLLDNYMSLLSLRPEIVLCKDCKHADYGTDEDGNRFMKCIGSVKCYGGTTPDFFCADGEKRE